MLDGYVPPLVVIAVGALLSLRFLVGRRRGGGWVAAAVAVAAIGTAAALEFQMGRTPTYRHGPVRYWVGNIQSDQNSQQVSDPYTLTHVLHGVLFYGLTRATMGPSSVALRAVTAITAESAWEALENTDMVINRYRAGTVSLGYYGDSILNSVADIVACALGFLLAWRLPTRLSVAFVIGAEALLAVWIRDNLTLNIIMLVHPLDAIRRWQLGG
jgi:hypothetical protein